MLLALGLQSSRHVQQLRLMCERWEVPHDHLGHRAPADDLVREVLATARSWPEALSRLGYAGSSGSARSALRRHALRLGLDVRALASTPTPEPHPVPLRPDLRHLRDAGVHFVAGAVVLAGHRVLWPLEPGPYDLVVEMRDRLLRVQVKTTSRRVSGTWVCSITRSEYADVAGSKRRVCYQPGEVDLFAVVDGDQEVYLIPYEDVAGMTALSMRRYLDYRVPRVAGTSHAEEPPDRRRTR